MTWPTHTVTNQAPPLQDYNLFTADPALREALGRADAAWAAEGLARQGEALGTAASFAQGHLANQYPPRLRSFDARGHRLDEIDFHPAWHALMADIARRGLHTGPWAQPRPGVHAARAAGFILQTQIEAGSMCPTTMTYGAIPALARDAGLMREALPVLLQPEYDPRDLPLARKRGGLIGMGMTEKQGGSDLRSNTTRAESDGAGGYRLTGHKWFFSAPQCDAHLVLAQAPGGLSCYFVPRWAPDGSRNPVLIQRLKDKLGNRSNASSEVEFQGAWGHLLGEEGRGIPTILEMGTYTRLDCVLGTTGLMRQALSQAVHYARHRRAFGAALIDQPMMRNVLADMALEVEAAMALAMRLAQAFDAQHDEAESLLRRLLTPAAKFRVCKRGAELAAEAMEVLGGNGYVEDDVQARIYREMPVNSIWEGSGNVMCLDVLRALGKNQRTAQALMAELEPAQGRNAPFDAHLHRLSAALREGQTQPGQARAFAHDLVLAVQAALLLRHAPEPVAQAFCASRLGGEWGGGFGTLSPTADFDTVLGRALVFS